MWFFTLLLLFIGAALSSSRKWKINKLPGVSFCLLPLSWAAAAFSSLSHQTISNQRYSGWLAPLITHDIKWHQTPVAAAGTNNTSDSSNRGIHGCRTNALIMCVFAFSWTSVQNYMMYEQNCSVPDVPPKCLVFPSITDSTLVTWDPPQSPVTIPQVRLYWERQRSVS